MPTIVTARDGDCLCGIASDFGLAECKPLREAAENSSLLGRELRAGDEVTIPDLSVEDHPRAVDTKHTFKLKTSPPVNIRFVHGSKTLPYRDDSETTTLHVSNFVTNLGGKDGLKALPTGYGFNEDGDEDPDTFKVEVWDPAAGGSVNVRLEALKPVYTAGPGGKLTVTSFTPFTDAGRFIDPLVCNVVSSATSNTYRSKYMRLVTDEVDLAAPGFPNQFLLTTDVADGLGTGAAGDNDTVEILDQMVRATYEVTRCTGSPKCKVSKIVDIGGANRKRISLKFYAVRTTAGVDTMPTGVSADDIKKHLRRRTFKWYRRVFAQADMAPLLEGIEIVDPPQRNMIIISGLTGAPVTAGGGVTIDITLKTPTRTVVVPTITFAGGETPLQAAGVIAAAMPAGFTGAALPCALADGLPNPAADVILTADNGERVTLNPPPVLSAGAGIDINVPVVDLMKVDASNNEPTLGFATGEMKRLLRMVPVTDDTMHCVVVGRFNTISLRGQAFRAYHTARATLLPILPLRSSTIMAYEAEANASPGPPAPTFVGVLDNGDTLPFTSPHESAHVICDISHTVDAAAHSRTELLGSGTNETNAVDATKRLGDGPYLVKMFRRTEADPPPQVDVRLAQEIRDHSAVKLRDW